jgi:hypothetical protein
MKRMSTTLELGGKRAAPGRDSSRESYAVFLFLKLFSPDRRHQKATRAKSCASVKHPLKIRDDRYIDTSINTESKTVVVRARFSDNFLPS